VHLMKAMYILFPEALEVVYPGDLRVQIAELVDIGDPQTRESVAADPLMLADVEVLLSGWGAPVLDAAFLAAAPKLRAVFYGAGSIRTVVTPAFWERDIHISTAAEANSQPVAEYVVASILLSLKHFWSLSRLARTAGDWYSPVRGQVPGAYRSRVGIVSVGKISRRLLQLLEPYELHRMASCPWLTALEAERLRVERVPLKEIFRRADVVSLHTPDLPETRGMITGEMLASMKPGATFINTARGAVVRQREMIEVLRGRPDLTAVLDVTDPEPPEPGSPLLTLPNVVLTPHIAGSLGPECSRMGQAMVDELRRFLAGRPLLHRVSREIAERMA
jgi:phosphoglycerate dehydrogenase-like enzyme